MNEREESRHNLERRNSDAWMQIKAAEIQQRNSTIAVLSTIIALLLAGSWWLAEKAADEKVAPVNARLVKVEVQVKNTDKKVDDMRSDMREDFKAMFLKMDKLTTIVIENRK